MNTTETRSTSTERVRAHRKRIKRGMHRRSITLTDVQLDALEVRGYLDPDRRGDRDDECDAIETFLMVALEVRGDFARRSAGGPQCGLTGGDKYHDRR